MSQPYAARTDNNPDPVHLAQGCPASGWIHEGGPPYRVIVASSAERLKALLPIGQPEPYTGSEETVDVDEWRMVKG